MRTSDAAVPESVGDVPARVQIMSENFESAICNLRRELNEMEQLLAEFVATAAVERGSAS